MTAPLPTDESARLEALHSICILDTPPEDDFDHLARLARFVCNVPIATITFIDRHRQWFKSRLGLDATETPREFAFCAHTIRESEQGLIVQDALLDSRFASNPLVTGEPNIRFYAGFPVVGPEGHALGSLCVIDRQPRQIDEATKVALRVLARQASALILIRSQMHRLRKTHEQQSRIEQQLRDSQDLLQEANGRLERMVRTDSLTGLGNRRLFDERLRQEWRLSRNLGVPLSLLMIDIDHFKRINDTRGHTAGDAVLRKVATLLSTTTRETDTCTRYGGEEFAILLPATEIAKATELAERLRIAVAGAAIGENPVTISIGVATGEPQAPDFGGLSLVEHADSALYAAKQAGRNRVVTAHVQHD